MMSAGDCALSNARKEVPRSLRTIAITALVVALVILPILAQPSKTYAVNSSIPFSQILTDVVRAPAQSVWIVMPDYNVYGGSGQVRTSSAKCGTIAAMDTDIFAATYLLGALNNPQNEILDTNPLYISQASASCGQPAAIPITAPIVIVAGPVVNQLAQYYLQTTRQTVLYFDYNTNCIARRDTNQSVACDATSPTRDILAIEAFRDSVGRPVYVFWGKGYQGTFSGITYLVEFILKNPSAFSNSWYVLRWDDASSGLSAKIGRAHV
jgi:hypothetical protein